MVAILKIDVSAAPADVEIRVDGIRIKKEEYALLEIDSGHHDLEARAPGKQTFRMSIDIDEIKEKKPERDRTTPKIIPKMADALPPIVIDHGKNRKLIAYGLGVVALGFGTACLLYNLHQQDLADPAGQATLTPAEARHNIRVYGTLLFGGAVAAIGGAVVLYVTAPGKETRERTSFAPVITSDQLGFAFSRSW
jgi:hypothetical protein